MPKVMNFAISLFAFLLCLVACKEKKSNELEQIFQIQDYYNNLVPHQFPQLNLSDSVYSVIIRDAPEKPSYIFNSDTILAGTKSENGSIELVVNKPGNKINKFTSSETNVGTPFVSSEYIDNRLSIQLNFYTPSFYISDPDNSKQDYLPVLIHEMAHLTERTFDENENEDEYINTASLFEYFDSDTLYSKLIIEENALLLQALAAETNNVSNVLSQYFELKNKRMEISADSLMKIEPEIEASEGYGRYIEYLCKKDLDNDILLELTGFKTDIPAYDISDEKWMFDVSHTNGYMYCTGFNKIRILRKFLGDDFLNIYSGKEKKDLDIYLKKIVKGHIK